MASKVQVANRALQKVGVTQRLGTIDDAGLEGRAIRTCYDSLRDAELSNNAWTFAIVRTSIAADTASPDYDYLYQYQLPSDFVRKAPTRPLLTEFGDGNVREGNFILSNDPGPLNIRYVSNNVDEEFWHPLFVEGLAARIAFEIAEELTQSSSKQDSLATAYVKFISQAKRQNAIEKGIVRPNVDDWEAVRSGGYRNVPWYDGTN
jgi:hypothetical protein